MVNTRRMTRRVQAQPPAPIEQLELIIPLWEIKKRDSESVMQYAYKLEDYATQFVARNPQYVELKHPAGLIKLLLTNLPRMFPWVHIQNKFEDVMLFGAPNPRFIKDGMWFLSYSAVVYLLIEAEGYLEERDQDLENAEYLSSFD